MRRVFVAGVGMTGFGRHLRTSLKTLAQTAVRGAVDDAGLALDDLDVAFFGNCSQGYMTGQHFIRGQVALHPMGLEGIPITNVENACATASTALHLAVCQVKSGLAEVALAVGAEKMYDDDKAKMFGVFDSAWDVDTPDENAQRLVALGAGVVVPPGTTTDKPYSVFMDVYAANARNFMKRYGTTQRQLAAIASKNHKHSEHNERAQYRRPMTIDEVLAATPITYPLTVPMCSPVSDGAAAAIVCSEEAIKRLGIARSRAVEVLASVQRSATNRGAEERERHITRLAAEQAYEQAGLGPSDMDVAEVHDGTAMGELMQCENLALCAFGEGGPLAESGATAIGGRIPINPSGGLESKGHPIGATGLGQVFELVSQLRGECGRRQVEGARIAIQENGGGLWGYEEAAAHVCIFAKGGAR